MDKKQEDKNIKKKKEKNNLIIDTISVVVIFILFLVGIICSFHGASKYVVAAFAPCSGLIALALVLRSDNHGIKKVIGIIGTLILIVVFPLIYILTN